MTLIHRRSKLYKAQSLTAPSDMLGEKGEKARQERVTEFLAERGFAESVDREDQRDTPIIEVDSVDDGDEVHTSLPGIVNTAGETVGKYIDGDGKDVNNSATNKDGTTTKVTKAFIKYFMTKANGDDYEEEQVNPDSLDWQWYIGVLGDMHYIADSIEQAEQAHEDLDENASEEEFERIAEWIDSDRRELQDTIKAANALRARAGDDVYLWDQEVKNEYGYPSQQTDYSTQGDMKTTSFADSIKNQYGPSVHGLDLEALHDDPEGFFGPVGGQVSAKPNQLVEYPQTEASVLKAFIKYFMKADTFRRGKYDVNISDTGHRGPAASVRGLNPATGRPWTEPGMSAPLDEEGKPYNTSSVTDEWTLNSPVSPRDQTYMGQQYAERLAAEGVGPSGIGSGEGVDHRGASRNIMDPAPAFTPNINVSSKNKKAAITNAFIKHFMLKEQSYRKRRGDVNPATQTASRRGLDSPTPADDPNMIEVTPDNYDQWYPRDTMGQMDPAIIGSFRRITEGQGGQYSGETYRE